MKMSRPRRSMSCVLSCGALRCVMSCRAEARAWYLQRANRCVCSWCFELHRTVVMIA